jgi:hypothetical protein
LRSVPPLGALGVATGAIAIGTTVTSTLTTTTISIATTTSTASKEVSFSTTRNTAATRPMGTGKRRISTADVVRVAPVVPVVRVALVVSEDPVEPAV